MLTSDREVNRDFDVNNLFLNLDFQHQEETFEYKWPLLDHPSNYQMIVTKLLTRTTLPYIKLHESKKRNKSPPLKYNDYIAYDYMIKLRCQYIKDKNTLSYETINQNLIKFNNSKRTPISNYKNILNQHPEGVDKSFVVNFCNREEEYQKLRPNGEYAQEGVLNWFDSKSHRDIYTLEQIYQMINVTLYRLVQRYTKLEIETDEYYNDCTERFTDRNVIFIRLVNGRPELWIEDNFLEVLHMEHNYSEDNINERKHELLFSKNLAKFLKGLHIEPSTDYPNGEYYVLNITKTEWKSARIVFEPTNFSYKEALPPSGYLEEKYDYSPFRVFTGEKLNIMELSDYIGLAITTPDFPIKEQIYPQFNYDFDENFFQENRRRYIPKTEENIKFVLINKKRIKFEKQNITDLVKSSTGDKILFVKYFDPKTEDLNAISYENNNSATTLKMDLMNVMPLKKFTLKLYLIDRYNNFEPLIPKIEGFDDVIKLQLLFIRIKGTEKENRNIIETKKEVPERYIMGLEELDDNKYDDEEEEENNEPEITNEPEILPDIKFVSVPAITNVNDEILPDINIIPVPAINTEKDQDSDDEDDIEPPPEKRIYLGNENEDSENENELY